MGRNVIIANERACWGRGGKYVRRAVRFFEGRGYEYSLLISEKAGHACQLAAHAASEGAETVIVAGGDGTINEVVNGMLESGTEQMPRLGIVPAGSSNDLAKSLGIAQKLEQACETIIEGRTKLIDVGEVSVAGREVGDRNGPSPRPEALRLPPSDVRVSRWNSSGCPQVGRRYFCMASTVGLLADVAAESFRIGRLRGAARYLVAAMRVVRKIGDGWDMRIEADGRTFRGSYGSLLVSNAKRFGGLTLAPEAKCDDGLFDCLLVEMPTKREALRLILLALRKGLKRHKKAASFQAESLRVSIARSARLCNDGEVYPLDCAEISYRILPRRLEVLCQGQY